MIIHRIIDKTKAEGPGTRFCIYVQGCSIHCPGCVSQHLWDPHGGQEVNLEDIIKRLQNIENEVDGITLIGGEPFDQADELCLIAEFAKSIDKNVITFTGYNFECLEDKGQYTARLLANTDLLCEGPYVKELTDFSRPMLGSSNQRFIYLSDKITSDDILNYNNSFEIRVGNDGKSYINGMGNINKAKKYLGIKEDYYGSAII